MAKLNGTTHSHWLAVAGMTVLLLTLCGSVRSEGVTDAMIDAYAARSKEMRAKALKGLRTEATAIRRNQSLDRNQKRANLEALQQRIKVVADKKQPYYAPMTSPLTEPEVGDIGYVDEKIEVSQVLADNQILARSVAMQHDERGRPKPSYGNFFWLDGVDLSRLTDDKIVQLSGVFYVSGTKRYETATGSNTVPVLERVDMQPHETKFSAEAKSQR